MRRALLPALLVLALLAALAAATVADRRADDVQSADGPDAAVSTPLLSPRRVPNLLVEPAADAALTERLTDLVGRSPEGTCLVVRRNGVDVFAHNPDRWVTPASTQKILTAAAALDELGPDHTFSTMVRALGEIDENGVLDTDLWLVGGGDPVLDTPQYEARFPADRPTSDLEGLADQLVAAGLTTITGGVMGDETRYDTLRSVPSWTPGIVEANRAGPLSALMINDGFSSWPAEDPDNAGAVPATDPAAEAASQFDDLLEDRGITIEAGAGSGVVPDGAQVLATLESIPLSAIVAQMNTDSDNTTAELLVKELATRTGGDGSTATGADMVEEKLRELETPTVSVADGSGLSRDNITTCATLTAVLDHHGPESDLAASLAIGGETGTLATRFLDPAVRGRIRAKSGSLSDAAALAGLARTSSDHTLTFAYVINGPLLDNAVASALQDDLAAALVAWPEGPSLDDVGPR